MSVSKEIQRQRRKKRIRARIFGTAEKPRLAVFRSLRCIEAQLIDDSAGKTLAGVSSRTYKNPSGVAAAQKVGEELAKAAQVKTCVFDRNGYAYHGRVKAVAEGARAGGLQF